MTDTRTEDLEVEMADPSTEGKQLVRGGAKAQQLEEAKNNLLTDVFSHKGEIEQFLNLYGETYERFEGGLRLFLMRQMQNDPDFFTKITAISFMEALLRCAKDGLMPDGKEAAIAAYRDRDKGYSVATYLPMRDGFVKVLWRTGMIRSINDQVVTADEEKAGRFEYEEGDRGFIRHRPMMTRSDTDPIVAAYCVIELTNGGLLREVVPGAELKKIAAISRSPARKAWAHQMHRKAAIRRIMSKMPREKGIAQLLQHDEANYDLTVVTPAAQVPSGVAARLPGNNARPGFSPGHAEAQTNPLSTAELNERLGGDNLPQPQTTADVVHALHTGQNVAFDPETGEVLEDRVGEFLAGGTSAPDASPPADDPAPIEAATTASSPSSTQQSTAKPPATDAALEERIDAYIKAMDDAKTQIALRTTRDRASKLRAELTEKALARAEALDNHFNRRFAELQK